MEVIETTGSEAASGLSGAIRSLQEAYRARGWSECSSLGEKIIEDDGFENLRLGCCGRIKRVTAWAIFMAKVFNRREADRDAILYGRRQAHWLVDNRYVVRENDAISGAAVFPRFTAAYGLPDRALSEIREMKEIFPKASVIELSRAAILMGRGKRGDLLLAVNVLAEANELAVAEGNVSAQAASYLNRAFIYRTVNDRRTSAEMAQEAIGLYRAMRIDSHIMGAMKLAQSMIPPEGETRGFSFEW